jgi:hypothetical protein
MLEPDNENANGPNITMESNTEVEQNGIPTRNDNVANTINELNNKYENFIDTVEKDIDKLKVNIEKYTDMTTAQNKSMEDILKQLDHYARYIKK